MLRDYQEKAVQDCIDWIDDGRGHGVAVLPTAAGKSWIVAALANHYGSALVLQPSKELLEQNFEKYTMYGNDAAMYSASVGRKEVARVTFATLGSIKDASIFDTKLVIVDECHLYPTEDSMFSRLLEAMPAARVIGLTATPFRLERSMMGSKLMMLASRRYAWDGYANITQIETVKQWWSEIEYDTAETKQDLLKVNSTGAEYTQTSLELFAKTTEQKIREAIEKYSGKQILAFVPSIAQATYLASQFNARVVSSKTPAPERAELVKGFKSREIMLLFNVDVLGVGFDHPALEVLIDANPTMSLSRYYQRIGRLTRLHENDKFYVDFSGNSERFGKVEDLEFRQVKRSVHCFSGHRQLTGVYLHDVQPKSLNFGKYRGKPIGTVPTEYLEWLCDQATDENLIAFINNELARRW